MGRRGILELNLTKSSLAPNVSLPFIAELTDGFSGADLVELCQRAAKAAIRDAIAANELETDDQDVTREIGRKHFEEALGGARRSVAWSDLAKYEGFGQITPPRYEQVFATGSNINWPDVPPVDEDDDLYS